MLLMCVTKKTIVIFLYNKFKFNLILSKLYFEYMDSNNPIHLLKW